MGFSFAVWNVKRFQAHPQRIRAVGQLVRTHDPDVFGILEFLDKEAARRLVRSDEFKPYDFAFTDSAKGIEILVGWKRGRFAQALYTQRREMQAGNLNLRPGGLLSVLDEADGVFTNLLFLHTDSGKDAGAFANRQAMFGKIWSLQRALAALPEQRGSARLVALGDLNTMGRTGGPNAKTEIAGLAQAALANGMRLATKTHPHTWRNVGGTKSNLDHVVASAELGFVPQAGPGGALADVGVDGWVHRSGQALDSFVRNISDHCLLHATLR
jgi:hypothetical protein